MKETTKLKEIFKNKTRAILYMYNMALVLFTVNISTVYLRGLIN